MIKNTRTTSVLDCDNTVGGDRLIEIVIAVLSAGYKGVELSLAAACPGSDGRPIHPVLYNNQTPEGHLLASLERRVCDGLSMSTFTVAFVMEELRRAYLELPPDPLPGEGRA